MARTAFPLLVALWLAAGTATAYDTALDWRAIDAAIAIGQSRVESAKARFHEAYRLSISQPPVDYIEVVTPFRRVALAAEARARVGDRLFGQRHALAVLAEGGDGLELVVELTFHPLNTYVGVPGYVITLAAADPDTPTIQAAVERIPRFGPRLEGVPLPYPYPGVGLPGGSQPLLGGTLIARVGPHTLKPADTYEVVIEESGKEVARARMDLGRVR